MTALIISSLFLGLAALLIYTYYLRKGAFDDEEDIKYQIFRDEENDGK